MINPPEPTETINAISAALAEGLFANWPTQRADIAATLGISENEVESVKDQYRQHCLNYVYHAHKRGGNVSY